MLEMCILVSEVDVSGLVFFYALAVVMTSEGLRRLSVGRREEDLREVGVGVR